MPTCRDHARCPKPQFAALVDALAADPARRDELDRPAARRSSASTTSAALRPSCACAAGSCSHWRAPGVSDAALIFVLEELDTGLDPYLVAAAARALRSYPPPNETLAPFVMRALDNIRYHDEPVSFESYGEYAIAATGTSAGARTAGNARLARPACAPALPELEELLRSGGLPEAAARHRPGAQGDPRSERGPTGCARLRSAGERVDRTRMPPELRARSRAGRSVVLQDHDGATITFREFFHGQPSIVVFFYTRCDNPLKCSLTIAKLARVQTLLEAQGLAGRIRTAAITYDPAFDLPERLRIYGKDRGVRMDARSSDAAGGRGQ